jgi:STE24 endopeptidase
MGHYVLKHELKACAVLITISFIFVAINFSITPSIFEKLPRSWGIVSLDDIAGIPFLSLMLVLGNFLLSPALNGLARYEEQEADAYALNSIEDRMSFVRLIVSLSENNKRDPDPPSFVEFWLFDHPSSKERIAFALNSQRR